jgi:hypothetical protein
MTLPQVLVLQNLDYLQVSNPPLTHRTCSLWGLPGSRPRGPLRPLAQKAGAINKAAVLASCGEELFLNLSSSILTPHFSSLAIGDPRRSMQRWEEQEI